VQDEGPVGVVALCAELTAARERWETALARVDPARFEEPGVEPGWSAKDLVAHVAWSQREWVTNLRNRRVAGSPLWELPLHERNAAVVAESRARPLAEVLAESHAVYDELQEQLARFSDEELADPARFGWFPPAWVPQRVRILRGFARHYDEHRAGLEAWLASTAQP
jgi:uncharacterized damage-inducible protein DinB